MVDSGQNLVSQSVAIKLLPQRWGCFAAMIIAIFFMQFSVIIMPGIANTIIPEMEMTPSQFGALSNMPYFCGVLLSLVAGTLGDKMGLRKLMIIALSVFVIGAFWRWLAVGSYIMMMISSVVMGFGLVVLSANSTKAIRLWFPNNTMGSIMGMYIAGASIGAGVALQVGPILGTDSSLLTAALLATASLVAWIALYRDHPDEITARKRANAKSVSGKAVLATVAKNKQVWLMSFAIFFIFGNSSTFQTFFNAALLQSAHASNVYDADTLVGTIGLASTVVVMVSCIIMPSIIAKFNRLKPVMLVVCVVEAIGTVLTIAVPFGILTWVFMIITGICLGGMLAMTKTVTALLPGVDPHNLGAVGGLQSTLQNLGGWLIAGYIIAPIAQNATSPISYTATGSAVYGMDTYIGIYLGAAVCSLLGALCYMFLSSKVKTHLDISQ